MNWKAILAITLALLVALPAVSTISLPAKAATSGVVIIPEVVGPGAPVEFYVNLTYLRNALGWVGSVIDLYWSKDGHAVLTDDDIPIVKGIYVADVNYTAGTVPAPSGSDLQSLIGSADSGYIYLKVSDGRNVAVSARLLIIANVKEYVKITGEKLAYAYGPLGTTNKFRLFANLTEINTKIPEPINFSTNSNYTVSVNFNAAGGSLIGVTANVTKNTTTGITSDIFTIAGFLALTNNTSGDTLVDFNGTLKDFPLSCSLGCASTSYEGIDGITYVPFHVSFEVIDRDHPILINGTTKLIEYGKEDGKVSTVTLDKTIISLGYPDEIEIFPSVEYVNFTDNTIANTIGDQINPNDYIALKIHNYPANSDKILVRIHRYNAGKETFSPFILVNLTGVYTTSATGEADLNFTLPEAPYGGLSYGFVVCVSDSYGMMRGLPAINTTSHETFVTPIKPYIEVYAATDDGTFRNTIAGPTAPGDYLLVKGHGFLQEQINLTAKTTDLLATLFDVNELATFGAYNTINVFSNGTFIAIAQIPGNAWLKDPTKPFLIVATGASSTDYGWHVGQMVFALGDNADGVQKVYVNPIPVVVNATYGYIHLGLSPAYPYPATWEAKSSREFTVEAIGLDPVDFGTVNVTIKTSSVEYMIATNVTPVHGYFKLENVPVPIATRGDYNITVYNMTDATYKEQTPFPELIIRQTAALEDPLTHEFKKTVTIMGIIDVNVTGYGWPANVPMEWDINELAMLGYQNFSVKTFDKSAQVSTDKNGYFYGLLQISLYINTPGVYHIVLHPHGQPDVNYIDTLNIGTAPSLVAKVDTAKTKLVGDYVDVWILVKFSNNELATPEKVSEVKVFVYAYTNAGLVSVNSPAGEDAEYTGIPGLWHYSFYLSPAVKGEDLAVMVEATGQYLPYLPVQDAYDLATLTVSGKLQDALDAINNQLQAINASINSVAAKLANVTAILKGITKTLDSVTTTLGTINTKLDSINTQLGTVKTSIDNLKNSVDSLSSKVDALKTSLTNTVNSASSDLKKAVSEASAKAKTYMMGNIVLAFIILLIVIYIAASKKG